MTHHEDQGRTNKFEGPHGTFSTANHPARFATRTDRILRDVDLFVSYPDGRRTNARSADQISSIPQRRRLAQARVDTRPDPTPRLRGFNLALTGLLAGGATA